MSAADSDDSISALQCQLEFQLDNGRTITAKAPLHLLGRLQAGIAAPEDVAIFEPDSPGQAILFSSLFPPECRPTKGEWERRPGAMPESVQPYGLWFRRNRITL